MLLWSPEVLKQSKPPIGINFLVPVNTILLNLFMANWLGSKAGCEEINAWVEGKMLLGKTSLTLSAPVIHLCVKTPEISYHLTFQAISKILIQVQTKIWYSTESMASASPMGELVTLPSLL